MQTDEQFQSLCRFTQEYLTESAAHRDEEWLRRFPRSAEYRWVHTLNVLANADRILAGEGADAEVGDIVRTAVILHDVSMFDCEHSVHGRVSAEIAERHLSAEGYPEDFIDRVSRTIAEHGTDFDTLTPEEMGARFSWEGKVLIEADILDKLGASALTNALLVLGKEERLAHECRSALEQGRTMQRAVFFKDYLWTRTGRQMAEDRFGFFLAFLERLTEEVIDEVKPAREDK